MSKKKTKKNNNYKKTNDNFNHFKQIDLSTYEGRMQAENLPDSEKKDFICYTLAKMVDMITDNVAKNREEKIRILNAATKIDPAQVLSLLIVKSATNATTTKQVLNIMQNINSYSVTPFINNYTDVGKCILNKSLQFHHLERLNAFADADYAALGKNLCINGYATLTPYGVLWNTQGVC